MKKKSIKTINIFLVACCHPWWSVALEVLFWLHTPWNKPKKVSLSQFLFHAAMNAPQLGSALLILITGTLFNKWTVQWCQIKVGVRSQCYMASYWPTDWIHPAIDKKGPTDLHQPHLLHLALSKALTSGHCCIFLSCLRRGGPYFTLQFFLRGGP